MSYSHDVLRIPRGGDPEGHGQDGGLDPRAGPARRRQQHVQHRAARQQVRDAPSRRTCATSKQTPGASTRQKGLVNTMTHQHVRNRERKDQNVQIGDVLKRRVVVCDVVSVFVRSSDVYRKLSKRRTTAKTCRSSTGSTTRSATSGRVSPVT